MPDKMPQDLEAEKSILGLMLISGTCLIDGMSSIKPDYFHDKSHAILFQNMQALFTKGTEVSTVSLVDQLKSTNSLSAVGGITAISELTEASISSAEFKIFLDILANKAAKRNGIRFADVVMKRGYKDSDDIQEFQNFMSDAFWQSMPQSHQSIKVIGPRNIVEERRAVLRERQNQVKVEIGLSNLDAFMTTGYAPQEISVIASRPSMGKSAFKTNAIKSLCERGFGVVSFATEQSFGVEQDRIESLMTGIPLHEIINSRQWMKGDYRVDKVKEAIEEYSKWNYTVVPARTIGLADVRNVLYQISQNHKIDVIFFDLFDRLQDVNVAANKAETVHVKLGELARLTEEFNCHANALVQVNRRVEQRANKRPMMSDLKSAGAYEEFARWIIFLYREKRYFPDSMNNDMEVIIGKQNNGPSDETAIMSFDEDTLRVYPADDDLGGI
jgi:replicative DNA helicase